MHPVSGLWEDLRLGQASLTFEPTGHRPERRRVPHSAPKCGGDRQTSGFSDPGHSPEVMGGEVQSLSSIWPNRHHPLVRPLEPGVEPSPGWSWTRCPHHSKLCPWNALAPLRPPPHPVLVPCLTLPPPSWLPAPSSCSCGTLGKLLSLSGPQFPHPDSRGIHSTISWGCCGH